MKLLGIDPGERWVGIALSDETGTLASPYRTIDRTTVDLDDELENIIREETVERVVVGFPQPLGTNTNERTRKVDRFIDEFIEPLPVTFVTVSERYTTKEAKRLRAERDDKPSEAADEEAAALILQHYIDRDSNHDPGETDLT